MNEQLVSVCINAYNASKTISETLKSVCGQTYTNLQVIVVDDCSADNTAEIVKSFPDRRIELYELPRNGHISNANNEAFSHARGEFIAHIDSDDLMDPELIETAVNYLNGVPECAACFFKPVIVNEDGTPAGESYKWLEDVFDVSAETQADFVRLFFDASNHLSYAGTVMRKSAVDELGPHYPSYCYLHDFDYWARLVIKHPIKLFEKPMAKYRISSLETHNSGLNEKKTNVHNVEYAQIIYSMINDCPDGLFLEAFSDRLRLKGEHTHAETEIEKAFLLEKGLIFMPENSILGILKFSELFRDYRNVEIARDKFGLDIRGFYDREASKYLYDAAEINELNATLTHQINLRTIAETQRDAANNEIARLQGELSRTSGELSRTLGELNSVTAQLHRTLDFRIKSKFGKVLSPIKHLKHFLFLRGRDGRKYKRTVMLYGYFAMNLGDDLFFETLLKRYPDTLFIFYCGWDYSAFANRFDNVKFFYAGDGFVAKLNKFGEKFGIRDLFEYFLLSKSDATLHLGGSIYQQVGDYMLDYKLRKRRKRPFKPFFSVSCNFGTFETDEFKQMWVKQFKKFEDICFRETYSAELFKDLRQVRCAPDLLFSYNIPKKAEIPGSLAISVCDPFLPSRKISESDASAYLQALVNTVKTSVAAGRKTSIISFCSFEGDNSFIDRILAELSDSEREKTDVLGYSFQTKDQVLEVLAQSEYIIGTRLHSVILGLNMGKKVLPMVYNAKIRHILDDLGYNLSTVEFTQMENYKSSGFCDVLESLTPFVLPFEKQKAELQFEKLDAFLKK